MEGTIKQTYSGCADGWYRLKAKGCIAACIYWANKDGMLPDWTTIACFPIGPNGIGSYQMTGGRAVPAKATHLLMRAVSADLASVKEVLVPIPMAGSPPAQEPAQRFLVLSDLHLSSKPWQIRKAFSLGKDCDGILIPEILPTTEPQSSLLCSGSASLKRLPRHQYLLFPEITTILFFLCRKSRRGPGIILHYSRSCWTGPGFWGVFAARMAAELMLRFWEIPRSWG